MKKSACVWCSAHVNVRDSFDQWDDMAVCSIGCKAADMLFRLHFSDVEMNRRSHYRFLTTGEDHD
jgi:hypothetical protein